MFFIALFLFSICLIILGDEYASTREGNNNWYGIDSK